MREVKTIIEKTKAKAIIDRLACQLIENHDDFSDSVIIGLQPRGVFLSDIIVETLKVNYNLTNINYGKLDITFFRDDFRQREIQNASKTNIPFLIENKKAILIDDVLYTGRSIRSAMFALQSFGRPKILELMVLVDRRYSRELPIQSDYTGIEVDTMQEEKIELFWGTKYPTVNIKK